MKSAKRGIFAVLGDAEVNDEDLETIFIGQGRNSADSRPLTVSDDPDDDRVFTPNPRLSDWTDGRRFCTGERRHRAI